MANIAAPYPAMLPDYWYCCPTYASVAYELTFAGHVAVLHKGLYCCKIRNSDRNVCIAVYLVMLPGGDQSWAPEGMKQKRDKAFNALSLQLLCQR
jgi:hypothetical protein